MRPASYDLTQHPAICAVEIERGEMKGGEKKQASVFYALWFEMSLNYVGLCLVPFLDTQNFSTEEVHVQFCSNCLLVV